MSAKFSGFTQDDIKRINGSANKENTGNKATSTMYPNHKTASFPTSKPRAKVVPTKPNGSVPTRTEPTVNLPELQNISQYSMSSSDTSSIDSSLKEAFHFKPLPVPDYQQPDTSARDAPASSSKSDIVTSSRDVGEPAKSSDEEPVFKGVSLRDYEAQRRMIEEQNRHKKQMLYKAIEQRTEQTAAESKKLNQIKDDLSKLEADLAKDVSILRKKIEKASIQYTYARQYYEQIEKAFLKAKLDMQHTREQKDLLGEHLNIIITNNEDRKAHKLAELMAKVGLDSTGEEQQSVETSTL